MQMCVPANGEALKHSHLGVGVGAALEVSLRWPLAALPCTHLSRPERPARNPPLSRSRRVWRTGGEPKTGLAGWSLLRNEHRQRACVRAKLIRGRRRSTHSAAYRTPKHAPSVCSLSHIRVLSCGISRLTPKNCAPLLLNNSISV